MAKSADDFLKQFTPKAASSAPSADDFLNQLQSNQSGTPPKVAEEGFSIKRMVSNIPRSGLEMGKSIATAVTSPVKTGKAAFNTVLGAADVLIPGKRAYPEADAQFEAVRDFFKQRYGGVENIKKTIEGDPVGFAGDLATILSGGGAAAAKAGQLSKVGALTKAGQIASKAGAAIEPLGAAIKGGKLATRGVGEVGAGIVGPTTGGQIKNARQALNPTKEFMAAVRGKTSESDIVNIAREGLQELKDERASNYAAQLEKVGGNTRKIDLTPIKSEFQQQLKRFNVKQTVGPNNEIVFDFSRSPINKAAQADIAEIAKDIESWGTQSGDDTALGLDTLKRKLDDFYTESNQARALVASMKNKVRGTIIKAVPDYQKLVKDYETASKTLNDIKDELSLGGKAKSGTTVRKLQAALRQPFGFREKLVDKLEAAGATGLKDMIAGNQMSPWVPRGIQQSLAGGGAAVGLATGQALNPAFWATLGLTSPRLMTETLAALGMTGQGIGTLLNKVYNRPAAQAAFQAGRAEQIKKESNP